MITKKGDELHEPGCGQTYNCIDLIKNEKIETFVFKIENAVGYKCESYQGTNKKDEDDN